MTRDEPEYIPPIIKEQSSLSSQQPLKVGAICLLCSVPNMSNDTLKYVNFTMIDENIEGAKIQDWFLKFMAMDGWTEEKMNATLNDPQYGSGMLYYHVFRKFDVLIVTPKKWFTKLRFGSIQRITSQMRSGVPVLVEVDGLAFETFVDEYNYTCAFSESNNKYPSLDESLLRLKDASYRKDCQQRGLEIARDFSPSQMGKRLLNVLGYTGDIQC